MKEIRKWESKGNNIYPTNTKCLSNVLNLDSLNLRMEYLGSIQWMSSRRRFILPCNKRDKETSPKRFISLQLDTEGITE